MCKQFLKPRVGSQERCLQENDSGTEGGETVTGGDNVGSGTGVDGGLAGSGRGAGAGAGARDHTSGHGHGRLLQRDCERMYLLSIRRAENVRSECKGSW